MQSTIKTLRDEGSTAASRHQEIESRLHVQVEELRTTNAKLLAQLHEAAEAKVVSDQLFDDLKARVLVLTNQVSDLMNSKIGLEGQLTKEKESLSALKVERDACLIQSNQRVSELEGQLTGDRESLKLLEVEAGRAKEELFSLRQELIDLHVVKEQQADAAAKASVLAATLTDQEIQSLKRQLHETENASTEANDRLQSLLEKSEIDFLALSMRYSESMNASSSAQVASDQEKEALREQLADLQSTSSATIAEWESLCKHNAADIAVSKQRVSELEGQLVENTTTNDAMVSLLVDHHDARVAQLTEQISNIQAELSASTATKTTLSIELSEQIITLQSLLTASSSAQVASDQEKEALREQLADLQSTSSATIAEWESLCKHNAADIAVSKQRVSELEGQLVENTTTNDAMVSLLVDHHDARVAQLTEQISNIQAELSASTATKTTLSIELSEQIITLQYDRDRQAQEWSSQRTEWESRANTLTKCSEEQTAVITDLRTQLSMKQTDFNDLATQLDLLTQSKNQGEEQIHALQQSLAIANEELVRARESTRTLQQSHLHFESESAQKIHDLKTALSSSQLSQSESVDRITAMETSLISWKDQVEELNVRIANMKESSQAHADTLTLAVSASQQRLVDLEAEHDSTTAALISTHHKEISQLTSQLLTVRTEGML